VKDAACPISTKGRGGGGAPWQTRGSPRPRAGRALGRRAVTWSGAPGSQPERSGDEWSVHAGALGRLCASAVLRGSDIKALVACEDRALGARTTISHGPGPAARAVATVAFHTIRASLRLLSPGVSATHRATCGPAGADATAFLSRRCYRRERCRGRGDGDGATPAFVHARALLPASLRLFGGVGPVWICGEAESGGALSDPRSTFGKRIVLL
jgi:hypothetical protein